LELFVEEPDREDSRVLFEREDLFAVFGLEREFDFDDLDFDDVRRLELVDPLPLDRELDFLLVAIHSSSRCLVVAHSLAHASNLRGQLADPVARLPDLDRNGAERLRGRAQGFGG
jgi:hypothetical protein